MKIKPLIFISLITLILPAYANTREPAVLPVSGISIDDYKEIPPEKAKGYHFKQGRPSSLKKDTISHTRERHLKRKSFKQVYGPDTSWPLSILLILLIAMPFILWSLIMKSLNKEEFTGFKKTLPFPTDNQKSGNDDDDDLNLPKAS